MVVSSYNTQMGKFNIDAMTLVYRRIYMYAAKDSPRKKFVFRDSP
jgi:singapore isolate B (sub-type 7) whole genome shotgun sequence assembly, scaffold_10